MKKGVIFVPGIKTRVHHLGFWKYFFKRHYPDTETYFIEGRYHFCEHEILLAKKDELKYALEEMQKTCDRILIITHSFGGVIAHSLLQGMDGLENVLVIMLAPPAAPDLDVIEKSRQVLGFKHEKPTYDVITVGGLLDTTLRPKFTAFPDTPHFNIWMGHTWFIKPHLPMMRRVRHEIKNTLS